VQTLLAGDYGNHLQCGAEGAALAVVFGLVKSGISWSITDIIEKTTNRTKELVKPVRKLMRVPSPTNLSASHEIREF